jgi:hypothetical protein
MSPPPGTIVLARLAARLIDREVNRSERRTASAVRALAFAPGFCQEIAGREFAQEI